MSDNTDRTQNRWRRVEVLCQLSGHILSGVIARLPSSGGVRVTEEDIDIAVDAARYVLDRAEQMVANKHLEQIRRGK